MQKIGNDSESLLFWEKGPSQMFDRFLNTGPATPGGARGPWPPTFFSYQKENREKKEKKKEFQSKNYQKAVTQVKMLLF